jgi:uncharacterized membrane protein
MDPKEFSSRIDDDRIVAAIRAAEARGRGEVRVHVTRESVGDAQTAAVEVFERLRMSETAERNGVLIYVAPRSHAFAVIGDRGVHEHCPEGFWRDVADAMRDDFRAGRFTEGIVRGVERVGEVLGRAFPREAGREDTNELSDAVSRD